MHLFKHRCHTASPLTCWQTAIRSPKKLFYVTGGKRLPFSKSVAIDKNAKALNNFSSEVADPSPL